MSKQALIVWGGWKGHEPQAVAELLARALRERGLAVQLSDCLDAFSDAEALKRLDLIVPHWTMGELKPEQLQPLLQAVQSGVGLGGCHGGMGDAFRNQTEYQFMTGGQFVAHPGGGRVTYPIQIQDRTHFITQGSTDFQVTSEQYYLHVDPANHVLASTPFPTPGVEGPHAANGTTLMPQLWTRLWGKGRVYYNALGHDAATVARPEVLRLLVRGLLWAARAEELA